MARLVELQRRCFQFGCHKQVVIEVFDAWNASHGRYCRVHGEELLRRLTEYELQDPAYEATGVEAAGDGE